MTRTWWRESKEIERMRRVKRDDRRFDVPDLENKYAHPRLVSPEILLKGQQYRVEQYHDSYQMSSPSRT